MPSDQFSVFLLLQNGVIMTNEPTSFCVASSFEKPYMTHMIRPDQGHVSDFLQSDSVAARRGLLSPKRSRSGGCARLHRLPERVRAELRARCGMDVYDRVFSSTLASLLRPSYDVYSIVYWQ